MKVILGLLIALACIYAISYAVSGLLKAVKKYKNDKKQTASEFAQPQADDIKEKEETDEK